MENLDDQTKKLLEDGNAYSENPEKIRQLADAIWEGVNSQLGDGGAETDGKVGADEWADSRRSYRVPWVIAASITGLVAFAGILFWKTSGPAHPPQEQKVAAV